MALNKDEIYYKIKDIKKKLDSSSKYYGKLLEWKDSDIFGVLHYGIGLSDNQICSGGHYVTFNRKWNPDAHIVNNKISLDPDIVIDRLIAAVEAFKDWDYSVFGWNCEHAARLIAYGDPKCYQTIPIFFLCNQTRWGQHKTAKQHFTDYLNEHPDYEDECVTT